MLYERYPALQSCKDSIEAALQLLIETYRNGGKVLICGNGGSAADSEHIVGELLKGFMSKRPVTDERIPEALRAELQGSLPAISLPSQCAILTAYCNDVSPEMMYAQLAYGYGKEGDLLIALSTSGNAANVAKAAEVARCIGVKTVALTGAKESKLSALATVTVQVPETETYKVQELHLPVYHYLCAETEKAFF